MIVTKKWLEDFVDLSDISLAQIVDRFINIGFEVEEVRDLGRGMERVRVGRITRLSRHPNADKLQICAIDLGNGENVQILTAATNVFEGALVPCALDGADLPNGVRIETTNMRGELSQGMLCSGEELVIDDSVYPGAEVDGIMILDESAKVGQGIAEFLGLDDVVLDIKVLANRPDCQSVMGLARELAAGLDREFVCNTRASFDDCSGDFLNVEVQTDKCPLYCLGLIRDCHIEQSNDTIRRRLKAVGINPKNNAVDLTNYILWETGHPVHAFDYDKISGRKIIVRNAVNGETVIGFDDKEYILNSEMLVIADEKQPIGIAGVMGGRDFSITAETKNIVIESAVYDRVSIRRTARALGLRTDASGRFERGVVSASAQNGLNFSLDLAQKTGLGEVAPSVIRIGSVEDAGSVVSLKISDVSRTLGIDIAVEDMVKILNKIDIETKVVDGEYLECKAPRIRGDILLPCDIIEEIIRFYGFSAIAPTYGEKTASLAGGKDAKMIIADEMLGLSLATGAYQVRTYGFRSPTELDKLLLAENDALRNCVQITNPLSLDYSIMRTQMLSSVLGVASFNEKHKNTDIKLCEIGKIFVNDRSADRLIPTENKVLAYLVMGKGDFYSLKKFAELLASRLNVTFGYNRASPSFMHPNICAEITIGKQVVGLIGKVHPKVCQNFDIKSDCFYLELNLDKLPNKKFKKIKALPKFPAAYRDMCIVVEEDVPVGDIVQSIKKTGGNYLESVDLFDIYAGSQLDKGKKSVAFNLTFRRADATLTQEEVNALFDKIVSQLGVTFHANLRA